MAVFDASRSINEHYNILMLQHFRICSDIISEKSNSVLSVDERMPVNDLSVLQVMVIESLTGFT